MTPVFDFTINYSVRSEREYDEVNLDLGGGVVKSAFNEISRSRADGTGVVSSYKGNNVFRVTLRRRNYEGDQQFRNILSFLQARKENNNEAFYFYNPAERTPPDPTGADTIGRYLVKFTGSIGMVNTHLSVYNFATLEFKEVAP